MPGDQEAAIALAEQIRIACEVPVTFEDFAIVATVSIGVAMVGTDPLAALREADDALIRAKTGGRNRVAS
jgi:PleD family two-component response regulator